MRLAPWLPLHGRPHEEPCAELRMYQILQLYHHLNSAQEVCLSLADSEAVAVVVALLGRETGRQNQAASCDYMYLLRLEFLDHRDLPMISLHDLGKWSKLNGRSRYDLSSGREIRRLLGGVWGYPI